MTPAARDALLASLRQHEGLRLKPYRDTTGHLTIGYGHNLDANGIPPVVAELLLDMDAEDAERDALRVWPWIADLDDVRYAVVVELAFNLGVTKLRKFRTFWRYLESRQFAAAAQALAATQPWATQVGARAERLAQRIRTGVA